MSLSETYAKLGQLIEKLNECREKIKEYEKQIAELRKLIKEGKCVNDIEETKDDRRDCKYCSGCRYCETSVEFDLVDEI